MEIQLSTSPECVHADTFVSLRIGDVQKQSRLSTNRTYHFPATGDGRGRFGRIEVFKRVGDLTVDLSKHADCEQGVEVPCNIPGMASLQMGLAVKGEPLDAIKEAKPQPGSARGKVKWDAAQKYIADHSLEDVLADAMREVIRHKPEDPFTFLSEQILAKRQSKTVLEKPAVVPTIPLQQAQQCSAPPAAAPAECAAVAAAAPAAVKSPEIFARGLQEWEYARLRIEVPPSAKAPPQQTPFVHRPSVGSWLQPAPLGKATTPPKPAVKALTPFGDYYASNMNTVSYDMSEKELSNFKSKPAPSPPLAAPPAAPLPPPPVIPFPSLPSVGSWLTKKPNFEIIKLKEEAARKKALLLELERKPFQLRPSVGTWLAPRPLKEPEPAPVLLSTMRHSDMAKMSQDQLISTFKSELDRKDKEIEDLKATLRQAK